MSALILHLTDRCAVILQLHLCVCLDVVITTTIISLLWLQMYLSDSYDPLSLSLSIVQVIRSIEQDFFLSVSLDQFLTHFILCMLLTFLFLS